MGDGCRYPSPFSLPARTKLTGTSTAKFSSARTIGNDGRRLARDLELLGSEFEHRGERRLLWHIKPVVWLSKGIKLNACQPKATHGYQPRGVVPPPLPPNPFYLSLSLSHALLHGPMRVHAMHAFRPSHHVPRPSSRARQGACKPVLRASTQIYSHLHAIGQLRVGCQRDLKCHLGPASTGRSTLTIDTKVASSVTVRNPMLLFMGSRGTRQVRWRRGRHNGCCFSGMHGSVGRTKDQTRKP